MNLSLITSKDNYNYSATLINGELIVNGTSSSAENFVAYLNNQTDLILKANKTYTISVIFTGEVSGSTYKSIYLRFGDNNVSMGSIESNTTKVYTYTPTVDTIFKWINFDLGANNTFTNMKIQIKVQEGSVTTPYSPYNQGTVTIKQRGKNLFVNNRIISSKTDSGVTITPNEDGTFTLDGTASATIYFDTSIDFIYENFWLTNIENTKKTQTVNNYTLSANVTNGIVHIGHNTNNGIWSIVISSGTVFDNAILTIQLEERNTINRLRIISNTTRLHYPNRTIT